LIIETQDVDMVLWISKFSAEGQCLADLPRFFGWA
jgi:hypothetical protein